MSATFEANPSSRISLDKLNLYFIQGTKNRGGNISHSDLRRSWKQSGFELDAYFIWLLVNVMEYKWIYLQEKEKKQKTPLFTFLNFFT